MFPCPPWIIVGCVSLRTLSPIRPEGLALSRHTINVGQKETSIYEGNDVDDLL